MDSDADSDFELDSPNWLHDALPHGERVNDPRRDIDPDADADARCAERNPECDAGDGCALHKYCVPRRAGRGSGRAQAG